MSSTPQRPMDHEQLEVYRFAVELDGLTVAICRRAGRGHAWLADQATRAAGSAVLNIAESTGRQGADRARCLRIARGSIFELDAALTLLEHRGAASPELRSKAKETTVRVVAMVSRLIVVSG